MTIIAPLPYTFVNGTVGDAPQVDANFDQIVTNTNANAAANGVNNDITQLTGLTTPLTVPQGGTGRNTLTSGLLLVGNGTGGVNTTPAPTTWVPADESGGTLSFSAVTAYYYRAGSLVFAAFQLTYPVTADTHTAKISLPVAINTNLRATPIMQGLAYQSAGTQEFFLAVYNDGSADVLSFYTNPSSFNQNAGLSGLTVRASFMYLTA